MTGRRRQPMSSQGSMLSESRTFAVARRLAPEGAGAGEDHQVRGLVQAAPAGLAPVAAGFSPPAPGCRRNSYQDQGGCAATNHPGQRAPV